MHRNKIFAGLVLILLTAVILTGCNVTVGSSESSSFSGNSQHKTYRFHYRNGHSSENLRVRSCSSLVVKAQTKKGRLDVELLDPRGLQVIRMSLSGRTNDERTIPGPIVGGTYRLIMDAEKAQGALELRFE